MLPGKKLEAADVVKILRRHFWLPIVPLAIIGAVTAVVAKRLPDVYQAQATIQVVPQRVSESLVRPSVSTKLDDRVQAMKAQILSRTSLEQIILEFDLYPEDRRNGIMENVVDQMRSAVVIRTQRADLFTVSYSGSNPATVKKVTERLATLFINQSLHDRQVLADVSDQFLETQLIDARGRLIDQEKKLAAYQQKYAGQLPNQAGSLVQSSANTNMQIQQLALADNQDSERRLTLERALQDLENEPAPLASSNPVLTAPAAAGTPGGPALSTTALTLEAARRQLASLQQHYSDEWPDVQLQKKYVDDLQRKLDAEQLQTPLSTAATTSSAPSPEQIRQKKIEALQEQIAEIDRHRAARQAEVQRLRGNAVQIQTRLDGIPSRESEMTELTRDYSTLTRLYTDLLSKKEAAKIAANLEQRSIGENFQLLDPAKQPSAPISPNRLLINLVGMGIGFGLGLGLMMLLEIRDASFKTDNEITALLQLPVLAVVPLMQSDVDRRRASRRRVMLSVGLGSTVAGCLAVVIYTFVH